MWVRLGTFRVKAGQAEALRIAYNTRAVRKVRSVAGNLGCLLLEPSTAEDGDFIACTLWASRSDAEAYESSGAAQEVVAMVRQYFSGPPSLKAYLSESLAGLPTQPAE
jgi:heme-degrading monooxygenase HmoA